MKTNIISNVPSDRLQSAYLDAVIAASSKCGAQYRSQPMDPVIAGERRSHDTRSNTASRIERRSRVIHICKTDGEEDEADADGCDEGVFRFLGGEHEDCQGQVGGQKLVDRIVSIVQSDR